MKHLIQREWRQLGDALRGLDAQTVFVLVTAVILVILHRQVGGRDFFQAQLEPHVPAGQQSLYAWGWWFISQGITGFVLPALALLVLFRRRPAQIGLGLGDWRFASAVALLYLPLVLIGTWLLSDGAAFQEMYPRLPGAAESWRLFLIFQVLYLSYWIGWEFQWRGFMLFGTAHKLGHYAIFVQAIPFALLHLRKPLPETLLSIVGGIVLGALVWRCRSFWIAIPIHATQMFCIDFWCVLRARTGVSGKDPAALIELLRTWWGS